MQPIFLEIKVYGGEEMTVLVNERRKYDDLEIMEMKNDMLAYRIAEIAREEVERIKKEKFLMDNPELDSGVVVESSEPF